MYHANDRANDRRRNLERNPCDSYNSRCTCKDRRNIPCTLCSVRCDYVLYADHRRISCGKIFDCNPYTTAAIGAALVYPDLVAAIAAEGGITFLHIPVSTTTYANTLFPIILASFFASKVEKLAKK